MVKPMQTAEGPTDGESRITVRGVTLSFSPPAARGGGRPRGEQGKPSSVLAGLDLEVLPGEFFCIVGESGCGKTTLLRVLAGLLPPDEGEVWMGRLPVRSPTPEVGFLFQQPVLLEWRTVLENVLLPVQVGYGRRNRGSLERWRKRALALLDEVGLAEFAAYRPRQLSGGMQQRVSLVRALLCDPEVLLMDEPFGALDAITRESMQGLLLGLWRRLGCTVVFVTHDIAEAAFLADRVAVMGGRPGRIEELFPIDLPRPRSASLRYEDRFAARCRPIRDAMGRLHGQRKAGSA